MALVGLEQLVDLVPHGVGLDDLERLVSDDLVSPDGMDELADSSFDGELHRSDLPRIRPILVALAARAAGAADVPGETQYAAEFLHLALSVHDTALGREGGRRRRAARRILKRSVGWLAGNNLTLRAMELSRARGGEGFDVLLDTLREVADGQALCRELLEEGRIPTRDDWRDHADAHTGALFAFCCRAGAHLAPSSVRSRSNLARYGRHIGRLWHAAEDISVLRHGDGGAHLAARALAGRPVLVVVIASEADPSVGDAWAALVNDPDVVTAEKLAGRVLANGALARASELMVQESWKAQRVLRNLPDTPYRHALDKLARELARTARRSPLAAGSGAP